MVNWNAFIGPTTLTDYRAFRYATLLKVEEIGGVPSTRPYLDSQAAPDPTMGVGFNLSVDRNRNAILTSMGFDVVNATGAERNYIDLIVAAINLSYLPGQNDALRTNLDGVMSLWAADSSVNTNNGKAKRSSFSLSDTEVSEVFEVIAPDYEGGVDAWATAYGLGVIPYSRERVALLSLAWNSRDRNGDGIPDLLGAGLGRAVAADNRAEAWFEIRYNSNGNTLPGIAKRRYYESAVFGLYGGISAPTGEEAKKIYRMLQFHRSEITDYENRYGVQVALANVDYGVVGTAYEVKSLVNELTSAQAVLFEELRTQYSALSTLDPNDFTSTNIYLDPGRDRGQAVTVYSDTHNATLISAQFDAQGNEIGFRDVLIGEGGDDYLLGGKGDDILIGGAGLDTYYWRTGDGSDRIIETRESDGRIGGRIAISNLDTGTGVLHEITASTFFQVEANLWKSADGKLTLTHQSPWQLITEDGSALELGEDFVEGDFGIALFDALTDPDFGADVPTTLDIIGDRAPLDFDPNQAGIQTQTDALGNVITDPNLVEARADTLYGSAQADHIQGGEAGDILRGLGGADWIEGGSGEDLILGGAGNDRIEGGSGNDELYGEDGNDRLYGGAEDDELYGEAGDDHLEGGAGRDFAAGGGGDDLIEGVAGADILAGGEGVDRLYGALSTDLATAIAEGHGQGSGLKGDWLSGNGGDDILVGGEDNDVIAGGGGADLIVGGAGDDHLLGAAEYVASSFDWTITDTPGTRVFSPVTQNFSSPEDGADTLYAGAGNDWVRGGLGDDVVYGDAGADDIAGEAGADTLFGGAGDDAIRGDASYVDPTEHGDDYLDGERMALLRPR